MKLAQLHALVAAKHPQAHVKQSHATKSREIAREALVVLEWFGGVYEVFLKAARKLAEWEMCT